MFYLPADLPQALLTKAHQLETLCQNMRQRSVPKVQLIDSFLSMEGELASLYQIKRVLLGYSTRISEVECREIQNIKDLCLKLEGFNPLSISDFKKAHAILLKGLGNEGVFRKEEVAVLEASKIAHIPPNSQKVPLLMRALFSYIKRRTDLSWIIRACLFHYGIQYIHPFTDGNGRMGRVWQHLLLLQASSVFHRILIGQIIKDNASGYYRVLDKCDHTRDGNYFVEFCLRKIQTEIQKKHF